MTLRTDTLANDSIPLMTFFENAVAYAKRSKVDVNAMKRDYFTTLLLKKKTVSTTLTVPESH